VRDFPGGGAALAMTTTPDLNRKWTLADVAAELWSKGISLKTRVEGYTLNFAEGGTTYTEYVTDNLIDALVVGSEMAAHPPAPVAKGIRKIRLPRWQRARLNAEWHKQQTEKKRQEKDGN
jgi:hypothetical protein